MISAGEAAKFTGPGRHPAVNNSIANAVIAIRMDAQPR